MSTIFFRKIGYKLLISKLSFIVNIFFIKNTPTHMGVGVLHLNS